MTDYRHPRDPDPVRSTKAAAVVALGAVAVLTGPLVAGIVPASIALILAREARQDLVDARGFLLGGKRLRVGTALAWTGIVLALTALTVAAIVGLLSLARASSGRDFAPTVN